MLPKAATKYSLNHPHQFIRRPRTRPRTHHRTQLEIRDDRYIQHVRVSTSSSTPVTLHLNLMCPGERFLTCLSINSFVFSTYAIIVLVLIFGVDFESFESDKQANNRVFVWKIQCMQLTDV